MTSTALSTAARSAAATQSANRAIDLDQTAMRLHPHPAAACQAKPPGAILQQSAATPFTCGCKRPTDGMNIAYPAWKTAAKLVRIMLSLLLFSAAMQSPLFAPLAGAQSTEPGSTPRHSFIPIEDLNDLVDDQREGVLLPRSEYDELVAAVKAADQVRQPAQKLVLSNADYAARIDGGQLVVTAKMTLHSFSPEWQRLDLPYNNLSIESATLNEKPAAIGRDIENGRRLQLFVHGTGPQVLALQMSTSLYTAGSDQLAGFTLAPAAAGTLALSIPKDRFLRFNEADVAPVSFANDGAANYSLAIGGRTDISLRITGERKAEEQSTLLFVNTVLGVKAGAEGVTVRAVANLQVSGRPIDQVTLKLPRTLDVTGVSSTGLERWEFVPAAVNEPATDFTTIKLVYRQAFSEPRSIVLDGIAATALGQPWRVPGLTVQNAAAQLVRVRVQHPTNLRLQLLEMSQIRRISGSDSGGMDLAEQSTGEALNVLDFAAWKEDFSLSFSTQPRARELTSTLATRVDLNSSRVLLRSLISIQTRFAPMFDLELQIPAEWMVTDLYNEARDLKWRVEPGPAGWNRLLVKFAAPVTPQQTLAMTLAAEYVAAATWPPETAPAEIPIPGLRVVGSNITEGTVLLTAESDFELTALRSNGLVPIRSTNTAIDASIPQLLFEYQDGRYDGVVQLRRQSTRIQQRSVAFHRVDRETVFSLVELQIQISGGRTRDVHVLVPESLGTAIRFTAAAAPGRLVEQLPGTPAAGMRDWTLRFEAPIAGAVTLQLESTQPRATGVSEFTFPVLRIPTADRAEDFVAFEASSEQQLDIRATTASGLPLTELSSPDLPSVLGYAPRERIVGVFRSLQPGYTLQATETRFDTLRVPSVIADNMTMQSVIDGSGTVHHQLDVSLRAVGLQNIQVELQLESKLWSAQVDGQPVEVRRQATEANSGARLMIPLPAAATPDAPRAVRLLFETHSDELTDSGHLAMQLPRILVPGSTEQVVAMQRNWKLLHPDGMLVTSSQGVFEPLKPLIQRVPWQSLLPRWETPTAKGLGLRIAGLIPVFAVVWIVVGVLREWSLRRIGVGLAALFVLLVLGFAILQPGVQLSRNETARPGLSKSAAGARTYSYNNGAKPGSSEFGMMPGQPPRNELAAERSVDTPLAAVQELPMFDAVKLAQPESETNAPMSSLDDVASRAKDAKMDGSSAQADPLGDSLALAKKAEDLSRGAVEKSEFERGNSPNTGSLDLTPAAPSPPGMPVAAGREMAASDAPAESYDRDAAGGTAGNGGIPGNGPGGMGGGFNMGGGGMGGGGRDINGDANLDRFGGMVDNGVVDEEKQLKELAANGEGGVMNRPAKPQQRRGVQRSAGGLLSLAVLLELPGDTAATDFTYSGVSDDKDSLDLNVRYRLLPQIHQWCWVIFLAVLLACWYSRKASAAGRAAVTVLAMAAAFGMLPLIPADAVPAVLTAVAALLTGAAGWIVHGIGNWISTRRPATGTTSSTSISAAILLAFAFAGSPSAVRAQEPDNATQLKRPNVVVPLAQGQDPTTADRVFIDKDAFFRMWATAYPNRPLGIAGAPRDAAVLSVAYDVVLKPAANGQKASAEVTSRWLVESNRNGQVLLPLPIDRIALSRVTLDGAAAALGLESRDGVESYLLAMDQPGLHTLEMQFTLPAEIQADSGRVRIPLRPVSAGALRMTVPGAESAIQVEGTPAPFRVARAADSSTVVVPVDAAGTLFIAWSPARSQRAGSAIVHVDSLTSVAFDDSGMRVSAGYGIGVRQGSINELSFRIPQGDLVREIRGSDVGGWEYVTVGDERQVRVAFRRSVSDRCDVVIELFRPLSITETPEGIAMPDLAPINVVRETGLLGVFAESQFAVSAAEIGSASQTDVGAFTGNLAINRPEGLPRFSFRFVTRPLSLKLSVSRLATRISGRVLNGVKVLSRKITLETLMELTFAGAPRSQLSIQLPPGYVLNEVASPLGIVADYYVESTGEIDVTKPRTLVVEFNAPQRGMVELTLAGNMVRLPDAPSLQLGLPFPIAAAQLRSEAMIVLESSSSGTFGTLNGWKSTDPNDLKDLVIPGVDGQQRLAFTATNTSPQPIEIVLTRGVPQVSADSLTALIVGRTGLDIVLGLKWTISGAGESRLSFSAPADWQSRLDIRRGDGNQLRIRETLVEPQGNGRSNWTVVLDEPQMGTVFLLATAAFGLPAEQGGVPGRIAAPGIEFFSAGRPLAQQRQFVMLVNQSDLQLQSLVADALETTAGVDLPIGLDQQYIIEATEIGRVRNPASPPVWQVQAPQAIQGLPASCNLLEHTLVLASDGSWRAASLLKISNRSRQFLGLQLPSKSRVLSVLAGNTPVRPVIENRNGVEVLLVPLPKMRSGDLSTEVQLVYTGRLPTAFPGGLQFNRTAFDMPALKVLALSEDADYGAPTARTAWTVYLPDRLDTKLLDDPDRSNVAESITGFDRTVAELNEALHLLQAATTEAKSEVGQALAIDNYRFLKNKIDVANTSQAANWNTEQAREIERLLFSCAQQETRLNTSLGVPAVNGQTAPPITGKPMSKDAVDRLAESLFMNNGATLQESNDYSDSSKSSSNWLSSFNGRIESAAKVRAIAEPQQPPSGPQGSDKFNADRKQSLSRSALQAGNRDNLLALNKGYAIEQQMQQQTQLGGVADGRATGSESKPGDVTLQIPSSGGLPALGFQAQNDGEHWEFRQRFDDVAANAEGRWGDAAAGVPILGAVVRGDQAAFAGQNNNVTQLGRLSTTSAGLSLPLNIPTTGKKFVFAKVGGDAKLALAVLPVSALESGLHFGWLLSCLGLSIAGVLVLRRSGSGLMIAQHLLFLAMIAAAIAAMVLPQYVPALILVGVFGVCWAIVRRIAISLGS